MSTFQRTFGSQDVNKHLVSGIQIHTHGVYQVADKIESNCQALEKPGCDEDPLQKSSLDLIDLAVFISDGKVVLVLHLPHSVGGQSRKDEMINGDQLEIHEEY